MIPFFKNKISDVTSVPAFALKAVFGSLTAPSNSARCARYFRTSGLDLSSVPLLVIKATIPPGRTLSSVLQRSNHGSGNCSDRISYLPPCIVQTEHFQWQDQKVIWICSFFKTTYLYVGMWIQLFGNPSGNTVQFNSI